MLQRQQKCICSSNPDEGANRALQQRKGEWKGREGKNIPKIISGYGLE